MSKATNKPDLDARPRRAGAGGRGADEDEPDRLLPRVALHVLMGLVLCVGCLVLFLYMRDYVERAVAPAKTPPALMFKDRPAWMSPLVAEQLAASLRPTKPRSVFDHELLV